MADRDQNTSDETIKIFCEKSNILAFAESENEYEKSIKRPFNETPSRKPKAIVKPRTADEICYVLKYASANHFKVSVLGGGHDPKGLSLIRDGLVLDMSEMKGIDVDVESATAWVEAGVTVKEIDDITCPLNLAAVNGSCTDVGVIGLILGGGFGFLSRSQGLASDNCLQMEVVNATGQRIVASQQKNQQLFWALRGAGHVGFGVVVRAQIKLNKLQEKYFAGRFCYLPMAANRLREFLYVMNEFCKEAEDEISFNIYLITHIPGVAVDYFYDGLPCNAERRLIPFLLSLTEKFGSLEENRSLMDGSWKEKNTSYQEFQQRFGAEPVKTSKIWKSALLRELTPEVIQVIINQLETAPVSCNPHVIGLELLGGEINRKPRDSSAYVHRDALFLYSVQATWKDEDEANGNAHACIQWATTAGQSLLAYSLGSYQNYADGGEVTKQHRLESYFSKSNLPRIKELKKEYDPYEVLTREHFKL